MPFVPQGRATQRLRYSRQGLRALATLSLAYATGCDGGGALRVLSLNTDASGPPSPSPQKGARGAGS